MSDNTLPLVLVPGMLCDQALFAGQLAALSEGRAVTLTRQHLAHDTMDGVVSALLAEAPPRFALAGLSMGGYVAMELVARAPERVERLALLDTWASGDDEARVAQRERSIERATNGRFDEVVGKLLPLFVHPDRLADEALVTAIRAMAERVGPETFVRQQRAIISRHDQRARLPDVRCPTLVLCGRQDKLTPLELSREIADAVPGAELVIIEDAGHLTTMERPDEVTRALEHWLDA